jgi:hypothetical protein
MIKYRVVESCEGYEPYSKEFTSEALARAFFEDRFRLVKAHNGKVELFEVQWNVIDFFVSNR